ncbi:hypothetical protein BH11GEM1_BH11GEM1_18800 [soil metagenome]
MDSRYTHTLSPEIGPPDQPGSRITEILEQGQALERVGQREEARALYGEALRSGAATTAQDIAHLHRLVSRAHLQDGGFADADASALLALLVSEDARDEAGRGRAINMLASIQWNLGNLDRAQRLFLQARERAISSGEARLAAMTATNLGMIATVRGEHDQALVYHRSSLADARSAGLADEAMMALNNLGLLHTQMKRFELAAEAYREALEIGRALGDLSRCMLTQLNVARLYVQQRDLAAARLACDEATMMARQLGDTHADGEAAHIYGLIARSAGDMLVAEEHFLTADKCASERKDLILQGETARELAELYHLQGRNRQMLQRLNQAHRLFAQLRARKELADVDRRTALLESDFLDVARKWGESIESKDLYTQGHCIRVADLGCALWATVCAYDDTSIFWFRIGALLHDVGKLLVPATVLNKSGKLTVDEWALVRRHPTAGVELLADTEFPWDVRPIVESHHERWDGGGYPHGLAGEAIPLSARVLCIADVYDALTSKRGYKDALSHDAAMELMRADVGAQFDPTLFAAFETIVRRGTWSDTPARGFAVIGVEGRAL